MSVAVDRARFDYARVIARAVDVLQRNLTHLVALTLIFYGLPKLGATLFNLGADTLPLVGPAFGAIHGVYALVAVVGFFAVQAMTSYVFVASLDRSHLTLGGILRHTVNLIGPVFCVAVVTALGVVLGLVLLVIPGLMLATAWMVAIPATVVERKGVKASLQRSADLTRDYRWEVFGMLAVMLLISCIVIRPFEDIGDSSLLFPLAVVETVMHGVGALVNDVLDTVITLAFALVANSIYCELRLLKEGMAPEDLASEIHEA